MQGIKDALPPEGKKKKEAHKKEGGRVLGRAPNRTYTSQERGQGDPGKLGISEPDALGRLGGEDPEKNEWGDTQKYWSGTY